MWWSCSVWKPSVAMFDQSEGCGDSGDISWIFGGEYRFGRDSTEHEPGSESTCWTVYVCESIWKYVNYRINQCFCTENNGCIWTRMDVNTQCLYLPSICVMTLILHYSWWFLAQSVSITIFIFWRQKKWVVAKTSRDVAEHYRLVHILRSGLAG